MVTRSAHSRSGSFELAPDPDDGSVTVNSDDGRVSYQLRRTGRGLWLRRERWRHETHARLVHSVMFASTEQFDRWCQADSIRFDYPIVAHAVSRAGRRLLEDHGR